MTLLLEKTQTTETEGTLAFSYRRLSSKRQADGHGEERQLKATRDYCEQRGLRLDGKNELYDRGVSAFTGANRVKGVLSKFLARVQLPASDPNSIPPGSFLICESLDRLSRDDVDEALYSFLDVIRAGIILVTLADGMEYSRASVRQNWTQLIISLAIMSRANEESRMKAFRLTEKWIKKREDIDMTILSAKGPSWLKLSADRKRWIVIPEKADIVRRIFEELAAGVGQGTIARRLNQDGIKPFTHGKAWSDGIISKLTSTKTAIGWYQPHKMEFQMVDGVRVAKRVPAGEPKKDYYPPVISMELYERAMASAQSRALVKPMNAAGRKGSKLSNLFSKLAKCQLCGGPLTYRDRGPRSTIVLICASHRRGVCENDCRYPYKVLEESILRWVSEIDFTHDAAPTVSTPTSLRLAELKIERAEMAVGIKSLIDLAIKGRDVNEPLAKLEQEAATLDAEIAELEDQAARTELVAVPHEKQELIAHLSATMHEGDIYFTRARLQQVLWTLFDEMVFYPDGVVTIHFVGRPILYVFNFNGPPTFVKVTPDDVAYGGDKKSV